ncbi:MAG: pyridine nucleotide-disulfide oxidoreductase [Bacillota bacterium]|jgi:thioredoxin reductase|nr:pyridine nucleotide-disulfide oxidoreductase [Bacillota bacterium]
MISKEIVIAGAGPAGLAAAIEAAKAGAKEVLVVDLNLKPGGQLFKQIHKFFGSSAHRSGTRGIDIGNQLLTEAKEYGVEIWVNSAAVGLFHDRIISIEKGLDSGEKELVNIQAQKIILATGASENVVRFKGWTLPGIMGAGAAQTMINVNRVKPGNKVVMLGSGNVGLIVSYQLMQAGCDVVALIEAAPKIGGYGVHAAKIRRAGVPIYTSHTIIEAKGTERVSEVVIAELDRSWNPIPGTEKVLEADVVTLAAGLKPISDLVRLHDLKCVYNAAFGGWVPKHDRNMESTQPGIYVVGDTTGVEEANTALEEGRLAGVAAAERLGYLTQTDASALKDDIWERLDGLRMGPFGEKRMVAKNQILAAFPECAK